MPNVEPFPSHHKVLFSRKSAVVERYVGCGEVRARLLASPCLFPSRDGDTYTTDFLSQELILQSWTPVRDYFLDILERNCKQTFPR